MKEFGGRYASEVLGDGLGASPGTSRTSRPGLCITPHRLDRMSAGHLHGRNGTHPRVIVFSLPDSK